MPVQEVHEVKLSQVAQKMGQALFIINYLN
jgi:hypothetical protein